MATGSLYLAPGDAFAAPPRQAVESCLRDVGLLGPPWGDGRYLAGVDLLRLITFAGCSPQLTLEPPPDGSKGFCHVELLGPTPEPRLFTGPHTLHPRCPGCGHRAADWRELAAAWQRQPGGAWPCPACGANHPIQDWRWRRHAVFGRLLVAVHGVFPAEAVPDDRLLGALAGATDMPWDYGWAAPP